MIAVLSGCVASRTIDEAQAVLDNAQQIHADFLAPYEFTSAEQFLLQAKSQFDHSDFDAATTYANHALAQAQKAYQKAVQIHPPPVEVTAGVVGVDAGSVVTRPKASLEEAIARAEAALQKMESAGARRCAPREFAHAEANLVFGKGEWAERDYNKAASHLQRFEQWLDKAAGFVTDCPAPQSDLPKPASVESKHHAD